MKTILLSTLLFISSSFFAQVEKLTWHTDLVKAIEISTKEKKEPTSIVEDLGI